MNFYAPVGAPKDAGLGTATVRYTYAAWKAGAVAETTVTVPVVGGTP